MTLRRLSSLIFSQRCHAGSCHIIGFKPQFSQVQVLRSVSRLISVKEFEINNCSYFLHNFTRHYASSTRTSELKEKTEEQKRLEKAKAKKHESPQIVLLDERGGFNVMTLEEAGKVAKKKNLFLIEIDPTVANIKSKDRAVYKLMTQAEFYGEELKTKSKGADKKTAKEDKTVLLKSKTSEHDVLVKVKSMKKMVEKGHTVRVFIGQAGDKGDPEAVYKVIEEAIKNDSIRIVQKVVKGGQIKFSLMPPKAPKPAAAAPKKSKTDSTDESSDNES